MINSNTEELVSCRRCKTLRPISEFYPAKGYANGLSWCRSCDLEKNRRYQQSNRGRISKQARERRQKSAELRRIEAARCAEWRKRNVEKVREYAESAKERTRKLNLRAKRLGASGEITQSQWEGLQEAYQHSCAYCSGTVKLGHDHVTPISRGGLNVIENVVPCCQSCNSSKRQRGLVEFLIWTSRNSRRNP